MRRITETPRTRNQRRSLEAVKRGIRYGVDPQVIIKPGKEPGLQVDTACGDPPNLPPDVVGDDRVTTAVTVIVPRPASHW
jgi:hypothetical protein